ncbi:hypothetical protein ACVWXU_000076 [Streptomyces sp. TE33382]
MGDAAGLRSILDRCGRGQNVPPDILRRLPPVSRQLIEARGITRLRNGMHSHQISSGRRSRTQPHRPDASGS